MNYLNVRKISVFFSYYCKKEALNFDILRFYCIFAEQISKSIENLKV